ncbi:MAG: tetratricopeptide repeat protein [Syntrophales bacterium]|nr:tetratricopeptide repeat protein [Syntrophales bacterium]MDD5641623.1 tetratricopeptide repeat protein [Syntrophales bacterium]
MRPSKSEAYYHYMEAQRFLLADDAESAVKEYEEALKYDPDSALMETELAALYQRMGEVKKALAHVNKALKLDPRQQDAHFILAGLHVGLNQLREATKEYERILTLDPENKEARLFLATLYAQQRRYIKAIRTIQELLRQEPKLVVGYYYLGRIYLEMDQLAEAKKELLRVLTLDPSFVPAMFDLGTALERGKHYYRALSLYRRIIKRHPKNARAWISIGRLFLLMHRYGDAQKAFKKAKALEKNETAVTFNIALIYLEQKLPDRAIRELRQLMKNPHYRERVRYYLGLALEEKGEMGSAAREYQLVAQDSDNFVLARLRLAYLYYQNGQKDQAFRLLEELKKMYPRRDDIYITLAYFYEDELRYDRAIAALLEGLKQQPQSEEIHFRLAVLYEKKKKIKESIIHIKKVLEMDPENPDAQNFLGYSYAEAGIHLDEAESLIRAALRAKPESGHIVDSLGWVFYKKGQFKRAVEELERAAKLMPHDGIVAEHLGDAYLKSKRFVEALRTYRRALGLENANIPELKKKIKSLESGIKESGL